MTASGGRGAVDRSGAAGHYPVMRLRQHVLFSLACVAVGVVISGGARQVYALSCVEPEWTFELTEAEADGVVAEPEAFWNDELRVDGYENTALAADRLPIDLGGGE